jgi:hypothetical protein
MYFEGDCLNDMDHPLILWFSSVSSKKMSAGYIKLGHDRIIPHAFHFSFTTYHWARLSQPIPALLKKTINSNIISHNEQSGKFFVNELLRGKSWCGSRRK